MTTEDSGGPAFPHLKPINPELEYCDRGMTLRDWFAGQTLTSLGGVQFPDDGKRAAQAVARLAYEVADAMLEARK